VDAFWNEFRPREETTKDINDSFGAIFDDLFGSVKDESEETKARRRRAGVALVPILSTFPY
jgi:hypothetical protein